MKLHSLIAFAAAAAAFLGSSPALAQWVPGSEITGQRLEARTNGVTNSVDFLPGGVLRISSPTGTRVVEGTWTAANGQLCMTAGNTSDCYPYTAAFQAGQPVTLSSQCNMITTWSAATINTPPAPAPERG